MTRAAILALALLLAACAGSGPSGPYVGGAVVGNHRDDVRSR